MKQPPHPILYSFRRCPFAIRARYVLTYSGVSWEHREVVLRDKPASLLQLSPKGTVPVMQLPDGTLLEESSDIMRWAVRQEDPENWYGSQKQATDEWIRANDEEFKPLLDGYKYPQDKALSQLEYRQLAINWIDKLDAHLANGFILGRPTLADAALFPFIRQFRAVDADWFDEHLNPLVINWLERHVTSPTFTAIMVKLPQWQPGDAPLLF
jgi:glutathione S-transferase